jgi:hypothetical protein
LAFCGLTGFDIGFDSIADYEGFGGWDSGFAQDVEDHRRVWLAEDFGGDSGGGFNGGDNCPGTWLLATTFDGVGPVSIGRDKSRAGLDRLEGLVDMVVGEGSADSGDDSIELFVLNLFGPKGDG